MNFFNERQGARRRVPFTLPDLNTTTTCAGCGKDIEADNEHLQRLRVCRVCLDFYSRIDSILDNAAIEKTRKEKLLAWGATI